MNTSERIKSLLSSYADWNTLVGGRPQPYHLEIEKEGQVLFYFGANHSRDPENFQYPALRQYWLDFLEKTQGENAIVIVEGSVRKLHNDEITAIHKDAESGPVTLWAHQRNIPVESPEPTDFDQRQELLKQFSKEEIQYYYFARTVHQWLGIPEQLKTDPKYGYETYLGSFLTRDKEASNWPEFDFSFENMEKIHKTMFGTDFDRNDKDFFFSLINPTINTSVINRVAGACSQFRNVCVVARILELWQEGKSIFVVFGYAHLILQERALRELLT